MKNMNSKINCYHHPPQNNIMLIAKNEYQIFSKTVLSIPPKNSIKSENRKDASRKFSQLNKSIGAISPATPSISPIMNQSTKISRITGRKPGGSDLFFHRNLQITSNYTKLPAYGKMAQRKLSLLEGLSPYCYKIDENPFEGVQSSTMNMSQDYQTPKAPLSSIKKKKSRSKNNKYGQESKQVSSRPDKYDPMSSNSFLLPEDVLAMGIFSSRFDRLMVPAEPLLPQQFFYSPLTTETTPDYSRETLVPEYRAPTEYRGYFKFIHRKKGFGFIKCDSLEQGVFFHLDDLVNLKLHGALWAMDNLKPIRFQCLKYFGKHRKSMKAVRIQLV